MGILYVLAYSNAGMFIHGAVLSIPLAYTFFHRIRMDKAWVAFLVTAGAHGLANLIIVLVRQAGGMTPG